MVASLYLCYKVLFCLFGFNLLSVGVVRGMANAIISNRCVAEEHVMSLWSRKSQLLGIRDDICCGLCSYGGHSYYWRIMKSSRFENFVK